MSCGISFLCDYPYPLNIIGPVIQSAVLYEGKIWIGGQFNRIQNNDSVSSIAYFSDSSWYPDPLGGVKLSSGEPGLILNLRVYGDTLIACGLFDTAGGVPAKGVAAYYSGAWHDFFNFPLINPHYHNWVNDISRYNGNWYVVGEFQNVDSSINHILVWDGMHWSNGGFQFNNHIYYSEAYKGLLIVSGAFTKNGHASPGDGVAAYDGTNWYDLNGNFKNFGNDGAVITRMRIINNELFICGVIDSVNGMPTNGLCKWDGAKWCAYPAQGLENKILDIGIYRDSLTVSGRFYGDLDTSGIYIWSNGLEPDICGDSNGLGAISTLQPGPQRIDYQELQMKPNPSSTKVSIQFPLLKTSAKLQITSLNGHLSTSINLNSGLSELELDVHHLVSGIYLVEIVSERSIFKAQKLIVQ